MTSRARRAAVSLALVGVAAVWGGTFVTVKTAIASYPVYSFLGWRFAIATVAFVALFPASAKRMNLATLKAGLLAGAFLTAGYIFQTLGLARTSPSKAAFITGMFVVMTPVAQAVMLRRPPRWTAWLGVGAAVAGLWLLSGGSVGGWNAGDTLVLACAAAYTGHLIVLGSVGRRHDTLAFTLVQLAVTAVACGAVGVIAERPGLPQGTQVWWALALTGVVASAVAFAIQTYAQRILSPTRTALILIMEPAFGGLFGWLFAGEVLGTRGWAGAALIIAGMAVSELLGSLSTRSGERAALEAGIEGPAVPVVEVSAEVAEASAVEAR